MKPALLFRPGVMTLFLAGVCALPSLVEAWRCAPLERATLPIFLVWLIPCASGWRKPGRCGKPGLPHPATPAVPLLMLFALGGLVAGTLLQLNALHHAALAAAIAGNSGHRNPWRLLPWLAAAFFWMPAAGWLLSGWPSLLTWVIRAVGAVAGVAAILFPGRLPPAHYPPPPSPLT